MVWGKLATIVATTLLLAGCSGAPVAKPTESPTPTLVVKPQTGDPDADRIIAALSASCRLGKSKGMAIEVPSKKEIIYTLPMPANPLTLDTFLHTLTYVNGAYSLSGWPSDDPPCFEANYAERVVAKGSPKNSNGVVFDYILKKIDDNTYDWAVYRQSAERSFTRIKIENGLVSSLGMWGEKFKITYGPLGAQLEAERKKALVAENVQYLDIGQHVWEMSFAEAKAYLKKRGLTILVGMEDGVDYYPSGPPGGKSDPKRMIVNIMDGKIVGVWTM